MRELVRGMCSDWAVSIRTACGAIGFDRSTFHYKSRRVRHVFVEYLVRPDQRLRPWRSGQISTVDRGLQAHEVCKPCATQNENPLCASKLLTAQTQRIHPCPRSRPRHPTILVCRSTSASAKLQCGVELRPQGPVWAESDGHRARPQVACRRTAARPPRAQFI